MATDAVPTDTMATAASEEVPPASGAQAEEEEEEKKEEQREKVEEAQLYSPHKSLLVSPVQPLKLGPTRYAGRQTTPIPTPLPASLMGSCSNPMCMYIRLCVHVLYGLGISASLSSSLSLPPLSSPSFHSSFFPYLSSLFPSCQAHIQCQLQ